MDWKIVLIYLSSLVGLTVSRGYVHFKPEYQRLGEKAKGKWTRWFNSDNPFIYDEFAPGGDVETIDHQKTTYGYHCDWGMPCDNPIGFEVDLSHFWKFLYPQSNFQQSMRCTNLSPTALTEIGNFECSNLAQLNQNWEDNLPESCFRYCRSSGQMYYGKQDPRWASNVVDNCRVCPDFTIRYFCLDDNLNCISKSEWLEWLNYLIQVEREQNVG